MRYPGILGRRKWRPKEEMGERERDRERVLKRVAFVRILPLKKPGLRISKNQTYALRGNDSE